MGWGLTVRVAEYALLFQRLEAIDPCGASAELRDLKAKLKAAETVAEAVAEVRERDLTRSDDCAA
jgi:hypothetical protein